MDAIVCLQPGQLEYTDAPKAQLTKGNTLVSARRVGICGTDLHAIEGRQPYFNYPRILGHELAVEIIASDDPSLIPGSNATILPYFNCGICSACKKGLSNCCADLKVFGVHIDGGLRKNFSVPSPRVIPNGMLSPDQLALVEPFAIGAHAIRRADARAGEIILVAGAGPIGLAVCSFIQLAGAIPILIDVDQHRLDFAKSVFGIGNTVAAGSDAIARVRDLTKGNMPDTVIDATGNLAAINGMFQFMSQGGKYVLVGLQKGDISFSHPEFHRREATLMSSRNATLEDFRKVIGAFEDGSLAGEKMITHRMSFENAKEEIPLLADRKHLAVKGIVEMD